MDINQNYNVTLSEYVDWCHFRIEIKDSGRKDQIEECASHFWSSPRSSQWKPRAGERLLAKCSSTDLWVDGTVQCIKKSDLVVASTRNKSVYRFFVNKPFMIPYGDGPNRSPIQNIHDVGLHGIKRNIKMESEKAQKLNDSMKLLLLNASNLKFRCVEKRDGCFYGVIEIGDLELNTFLVDIGLAQNISPEICNEPPTKVEDSSTIAADMFETVSEEKVQVLAESILDESIFSEVSVYVQTTKRSFYQIDKSLPEIRFQNNKHVDSIQQLCAKFSFDRPLIARGDLSSIEKFASSKEFAKKLAIEFAQIPKCASLQRHAWPHILQRKSLLIVCQKMEEEYLAPLVYLPPLCSNVIKSREDNHQKKKAKITIVCASLDRCREIGKYCDIFFESIYSSNVFIHEPGHAYLPQYQNIYEVFIFHINDFMNHSFYKRAPHTDCVVFDEIDSVFADHALPCLLEIAKQTRQVRIMQFLE